MKRHGGLWSQLLSWPNLVLAAKKARRGKRDRDVVQRFEFHRERELLRIQRELSAGEYRPGEFTTHWIHHPKRRLISAAPYRDRVVHHVILNVLEPILDRHFHADSYACRKGKGTHAAARRLQHLMRRHAFNVQCDIRKFFPSIDHVILKEMFRRLLKDRPLLALLDLVVDSSNEQEPSCNYFPGDDLFTPLTRRRGLPIGNLTSQWFANWYLTGLDHWVTSGRGVGGHVRYCDDFVILDGDRGRLHDVLQGITGRLARLRLVLHRQRLQITPSRAGRLFVGFRITPQRIRLRNAAVRAFRRRLGWMRRAFARRRLTASEVHQRLMAWLGHACQADSWGLVHWVAEGLSFEQGRFMGFTARSEVAC